MLSIHYLYPKNIVAGIYMGMAVFKYVIRVFYAALTYDNLEMLFKHLSLIKRVVRQSILSRPLDISGAREDSCLIKISTYHNQYD